jgi:hypothetical protein
VIYGQIQLKVARSSQHGTRWEQAVEAAGVEPIYGAMADPNGASQLRGGRRGGTKSL